MPPLTGSTNSDTRGFWKRNSATAIALFLFLLVNVAVAHWSRLLHAERERSLLIRGVSSTGPVASARYDESVGENLARYWGAIPDARRTRLVILSGMSQMYAINDQKPGDETIAEWLDDHYSSDSVHVFGLAAPNLANEEALFLLAAEVSDPRTTPAVLIFGVSFDKFRNVDLRRGYQRFLRSRPDVQRTWRDIATRYARMYPQATAKMVSSLESLQSEAAPDSSTMEARIRLAAGRVLPVVKNRKDLNAYFQNLLYQLRNQVFGINTATKRPIIASRYSMNQQFLQLLIDVARDHGVQVLLYVNPLNPRAANPYVPSQYTNFKDWLTAYAARKAIPFANLEDEVPADEWGEFQGGPDFMHFRGAGHRRTAAAIERQFDSVILGDAARQQVTRQ